MYRGKKVTTTIRISEFIRDKLREQAHKIGMDVSNYIAYLVMFKEEKDLQDRRNRQLVRDFMKALGRMEGEMLILKMMEGEADNEK